MSDWNATRELHDGDHELQMIPRWSMVLAVIVFIAGAVPLPSCDAAQQTEPAAHAHPHGLLLGHAAGQLRSAHRLCQPRCEAPRYVGDAVDAACGGDAGGIGAVVYFLLRQPILSRCPNCSTQINSTCNFCPQCQFQMAPVCGRCFPRCPYYRRLLQTVRP